MSDMDQTGTFDRSTRSFLGMKQRPTRLADESSPVLPVELEMELDRVCDEFEAAWKASHPRSVEEALAGVMEPLRPAVVRELVALDAFYRRKAGESPRVEDYSARFPDLDPGWLAGVVVGTDTNFQTAIIANTLTSNCRYELREEVDRGGMGIVYRASDRSFGREIAIKVLHEKFGPTSVAVSRFAKEAHITALLQHPAIPPVHDLGMLTDGRPFLAMKLIKGRTLDAMLKSRSDPTSEPGRYLAVFEQIAQGVAYAHAHRVVHRDLKPLNVMVGAFGEVQVMDWGLAKVLVDLSANTLPTSESETWARTEGRTVDEANYSTYAGSVFGTPAYMPREQAIGAVDQIDTRSDVFSLGGILCAVLTGRPPYVGPDPESIRQLAALAKLDDAFARLDASGAEPELIALCKRCLSPERDDRPVDAGAVAKAVGDLRAEAERRARQAELDRVKAEGERATAEARAEEETKTRCVAEEKACEQRTRRRFQTALAGMVLLLVCVTGGFAWWQDNQAGKRKLADERAKGEQVRIEAKAQADQVRLAGERDAEARNKERQAQQGVNTNLALAAVLRKQNKFKEAGAALVQALELVKSGAPERLPEVEQARHDIAFVVLLDDIRYRKRIWIYEEGGKGSFNIKIAAPEYHRAFAERGLDLTNLDPVEAAKQIAASAVKAELVAALDDWSLYEPDQTISNRLLEIAGQTDPGLWRNRLRDPAVRTNKAAVAKLAADIDPANTSSSALSVLAELMKREGHDPAALLSKAIVAHPTDFELTFLLGQWHAEKSKYGKAIGPYEAARAIRPESFAVWFNLGNALTYNGELDGAIAAFREAIVLKPNYALAHYGLGFALADKNDLDGAIDAFKEAIKHDPKFAHAHNNLGLALARKHDLDGAIDAYKEAIKQDSKFALAHNNLGVALTHKHDLDGAIDAYKEAIKQDPKFALAHNNLGTVLHAKNDLDGAIIEYKLAIAIEPNYALAHNNLGTVLHAKNDLDGAIIEFKLAIAIEPKFAKAHYNLGVSLSAKGNLDGAIDAY